MIDLDVSSVSKRLRELRGSLTQEKLAEALDISVQIVRNYEAAGAGKGSERVQRSIAGMKLETLYRYARYFNVSVDWILNGGVKKPDATLKTVCDYTGLSEKAVHTILSTKEEGYTEAFNFLLSDPVATILTQYLTMEKDKWNRYRSAVNPDDRFKGILAVEDVRDRMTELGLEVLDLDLSIKHRINSYLEEVRTVLEIFIFGADYWPEMMKGIVEKAVVKNGKHSTD